MTHLPFILAAYGLFLAASLWFGFDATLRLGRARRRLAAVDPRAGRTRGEGPA